MFANSKFHLTQKMVANVIAHILLFSYILRPIQLMGLCLINWHVLSYKPLTCILLLYYLWMMWYGCYRMIFVLKCAGPWTCPLQVFDMEGKILNLCSMLTWISLSEIVFIFVYSCLFILDDKFHICMIYGMSINEWMKCGCVETHKVAAILC